MSYYYTYYLGYRDDDGLIYPLGPYDAKGNLYDVLSRSHSFASNLHERFNLVPEVIISNKLREKFEYTDWNGNKVVTLSFLPLSELPAGDPIKYGYALVSQVQEYLKIKASDEDDAYYLLEDIRYDMLTPEEFAVKAQQELMYGIPKPEKDCEGNEFPVYSCKEYCFFSFLDTSCEEYETQEIRQAADVYEYSDFLYPYKGKRKEIIILLSEG